MNKTITYAGFLISGLLVIFLFVTAKDYTQLGFAALLYPLTAYLGLKVFRDIYSKSPHISVKLSLEHDTKTVAKTNAKSAEASKEGVIDFDRRTFLKIIGVAGLSLFAYSILSRKAEVPFFGKIVGPGVTALTDAEGNKINPAEKLPLDGYQISEIDDNIIAYYGFVNNNGEWFVMREDTDNSSFRYAKGDKQFPDNWSRREKLKYDYYHNVF